MGGPLPRTIEDKELLLDKNGLGGHRTDAARTQESGKSSYDMDEKDVEIAHLIRRRVQIGTNEFPEREQYH